MKSKQKIIIDCDPGHDDALALMLMVKSNMFNILAVTTVAGNSTIENTTNNARYVLGLLSSDIPVYAGESTPLKKDLIQAVVHGTSGLDGVTVPQNTVSPGLARDEIAKLIRTYPGEVSLLVIGPQTNIAKMFIKQPDVIPLIREVVIMGGAINVAGNKNRVGEFNIFVDPDAANIVFKANVKKVLIPLDVCNDIALTLNEFDKLNGTDLYEPVIAMMDKYISGIEKFELTKGALMYDPLAAYYLVNKNAYTLDEMDIQIETESELTRGMTVADKRTWSEKEFNASVVTAIDGDQFKKDFISILRN